MMNFGRWVVLGVCGAALLGCGGKSKPKPDEETGIILEFFDVDANGRTDQEWDDLLTYEDGKNKQKGNDTSVSIKRFENFDLDDYSEDVNMMVFFGRLKYVNNTLEEIDFDLRSYEYGFDIQVYARNNDGSRGRQVWSFEESLNWCAYDYQDAVNTLVPTNYPDSELRLDKDFQIDARYTGPSKLEPADEWRSNQDDRYETCPLGITATGWIGRDFEDIKQVALDEFQEYLNYLAAVDENGTDDCVDDDVRLQCNPVDNPSESDIVKAIYAKTDFIDEFYNGDDFHGDELIFDVVVDISINEFQKSDPFEFTVKIGYQNLD